MGEHLLVDNVQQFAIKRQSTKSNSPLQKLAQTSPLHMWILNVMLCCQSYWQAVSWGRDWKVRNLLGHIDLPLSASLQDNKHYLHLQAIEADPRIMRKSST